MKKLGWLLVLMMMSTSVFAAAPYKTVFGIKFKACKEKQVRTPASKDLTTVTFAALNNPAFKAFAKQAMSLKFTPDSMEYASDEMKRMGVAEFFKYAFLDSSMDGYRMDKSLTAACEGAGVVKKCRVSGNILAENLDPKSEDRWYEGNTIFMFDMNAKGVITGAVKMMQAE